jgi:hypothetical protein
MMVLLLDRLEILIHESESYPCLLSTLITLGLKILMPEETPEKSRSRNDSIRTKKCKQDKESPTVARRETILQEETLYPRNILFLGY